MGAKQMLRPRWLLLVGLLIATSNGLGARTHQAAQAPGSAQELRVLFIGNSLTYYNNLGALVSGIAAAQGGARVAPGLALHGGTNLRWHLQSGPARTLLLSGRWDYVVLQDHSLLGGTVVNGEPVIADPAVFHASVREWVARIRAVGAKPVLFMTWARRLDTPIVWRQQEQLAAAYFTIGKELGVTVAPVGLAWAEARRRFISLDLHTWDGVHPSPAGSYLAACVIYSVLAQRSPIGAPPTLVGHPFFEAGPDGNDAVLDEGREVTLADLPSSLARELQQIAWEIVSKESRPANTQMEPTRQSSRVSMPPRRAAHLAR